MVGTAVINHQHQLLHIQAPRCYRCGHQKFAGSILEVINDAVPVILINTCKTNQLIIKLCFKSQEFVHRSKYPPTLNNQNHKQIKLQYFHIFEGKMCYPKKPPFFRITFNFSITKRCFPNTKILKMFFNIIFYFVLQLRPHLDALSVL